MDRGPGQDGTAVRRTWLVPALVLAVLVVWWGALLSGAEQSVFLRVPVLDEVYYLDQAVAGGEDTGLFFTSPLYPRLIALAGGALVVPEDGMVCPAALRGIRILQIACWLGVVLLLYLTAGRTLGDGDDGLPGGRWLSWLPAFLFAFYLPASVFSLTILLEMPLVFLLTLHFYLLTRQDHRWWTPLPAGLALAGAGLLRGTSLVLLPLAMVVVWRVRPKGWRFRRVLLLLAAVLVPMLPAALHNTRQAGRLAGPVLNGGLNLYVGNGPQANGFYTMPFSGDLRHDPAGRRYLAGRLHRPGFDLAQADSFWTAAALENMTAHPGRTLVLWLKKIWLQLQAWEIDQLTPLAGWAREVPLLRLLMVPYGLLVVLGLAGIAVAVGVSGPARVWAWGLGLLLAVQGLFFVVTRYRLVLVPLLCLLSAAGIRELLASWQRGKGRRLPVLWAGTVLLAALAVVPWGLGDVRARWRPLAQANEARRWEVIGRQEASPDALARAEELYRAAVSGQPDDPGPWLGLAKTLVARDNRMEAEEVLVRAIPRVERDLEIRRLLVGLLLEDGRRSDALVQARALLGAYPDDAETLHNTTVLLAGFGNRKAALEMAGRLVAAHPDDPRGAIDLGVLLARSGRIAEARAAFQRGLQANPGHADLLRNLELLESGP